MRNLRRSGKFATLPGLERNAIKWAVKELVELFGRTLKAITEVVDVFAFEGGHKRLRPHNGSDATIELY